MKNLIVLALLLTVSLSLDVVTDYDIPSYLGDWFEVASSPFVHSTFEKNGYCVRARYGTNVDGTLSVYNVQRDQAPNGPIKSIDGYAQIPDSTVPAKLRVHLNGAPKSGANYWIIRLGPIINGKYEWAIVSEPDKLFMWVLARDPVLYRNKYEYTVEEIVTYELGFNNLFNKYVPRSFEGCVAYED